MVIPADGGPVPLVADGSLEGLRIGCARHRHGALLWTRVKELRSLGSGGRRRKPRLCIMGPHSCIPMYDWNDLRYFLAVAQHNSTTAAGRALQVDQSTVQRRLAQFERRIGQPLVRRHPTGYRLTEFGAQLLPHARRVEQAMLALQQHVGDARREISGVVRMTCPEPL